VQDNDLTLIIRKSREYPPQIPLSSDISIGRTKPGCVHFKRFMAVLELAFI